MTSSFSGKIIGIGFHKTGTSTLRESLNLLGFSVKDTTPRALIPILRGNTKKVIRIIEKYDAMEDTPWFYIYKDLDRYLPGSKFILTLRDSDSWLASISKHIGNLPAAHHEWIYGRGKGIPSRYPENAIEIYSRHNREVLEYFSDRQNDLLVLDFTKGDGWEKLCGFLEKPIPDVPFPHYNKTSEVEKIKSSLSYRLRILRQRIKNVIKIKFIDLMGWW